MFPSIGRRLAPRWAFAALIGVLACGSAFSTLQTGQQGQTDADQLCTSLLDVAVILDASGSIGTRNFQKVREFVSGFYEYLPVSPNDVHIAVFTFANSATAHWVLNDARAQNKDLGSKAAQNLPYSQGVTKTHLGLSLAKKVLYDESKGGRPTAPKLALLMTDGSSSYPAKTLEEAQKLRDAGCIVTVLGVGSSVTKNECRGIVGCGTTGDCPGFIQTEWTGVKDQVESMIRAACIDLAKDAICSAWSDFGPCQGNCGEDGFQTSTRVELRPQQPGTPPCPDCEAPKGLSCAEQQPGLVRTQRCQMPACKVDAHCGDFSPWSEWSSTCGMATRTRMRENYNKPPASNGGLSCQEQNPPKEEKEVQVVNKTPCPVQQQPGEWSEWSPCSASCGGGQRHRNRKGIPQEGELYGGETLVAQGIEVHQTETCNDSPCPVDADCGEWTPYSECSRSCGGGTQTRVRTPWLDNAQHGGRSCLDQHPEGPESVQQCNTQPCPVDEVPGDWMDWGPCSEDCGPGEQKRHRGPNKQDAMFGGRNIWEQNKSLPEGEKIEMTQTRPCENHPCGPCTAPFTEWTSCKDCSGHRSRDTLVLFTLADGACNLPTNEVQLCEHVCNETPEEGGGVGGEGGLGGGGGSLGGGEGGLGGGGGSSGGEEGGLGGGGGSSGGGEGGLGGGEGGLGGGGGSAGGGGGGLGGGAGGLGGGGAGGGGGATGGGGEDQNEEEKKENTGFPTAAVAGGIAGGILLLAAGGGAAYGLAGAGAAGAAASGAAAEAVGEAGASSAAAEERETLISAGEQSEMWAA